MILRPPRRTLWLGGTLVPSDESTEVASFPPGRVKELDLHDRIRMRIVDFLAGERGALR